MRKNANTSLPVLDSEHQLQRINVRSQKRVWNHRPIRRFKLAPSITLAIAVALWLVHHEKTKQPRAVEPMDFERHPTGILRYDWTRLRRLSPLARRFAEHQSNCHIPYIKFSFPSAGMGSSLHAHSQYLCHVMEKGLYRLRSELPWLWYDTETCASSAEKIPSDLNATGSAMECYFPQAEPTCPMDTALSHASAKTVAIYDADPRSCDTVQAAYGPWRTRMDTTIGNPKSIIRAATSEYLWTRVSPTVQREAERQVPLVFASNGGVVPPNLVVVHIRWGDKIAEEMTQIPIERYIHTIQVALERRKTQSSPCWNTSVADVHILVATEDPTALVEFRTAAPAQWHVYVDQFLSEYTHQRTEEYNNHVVMAMHLGGRPGLVTLGSLLVTMEADTFVLTTCSNWSRLMNELRKNVIDPRVGYCTIMMDLCTDEW